MKIDGVTGGGRNVEVRLPCSGVTLVLRIRPLPFGFDQRLTKEIPVPQPPSSQIRIKGRPTLMYDERDAEYLAKLEEAQRLHSLVALRYALADDTTVQWDSPLDPEKPFLEVAKETDEELRGVDFPMADAVALIQAVMEASGITEDLLEERASDFSKDGSSSERGSSTSQPSER